VSGYGLGDRVIEVRSPAEAGRMCDNPAHYSEGPGFKSRLVDRLLLLRFWWFSSVSPGECSV
jgi:hypothetical protein